MSTTSIPPPFTSPEPPTAPNTAVRVERISKSFRSWGRRGAPALDGCDVELPAGSMTALIGANGAGKTTLLSILAGLLAPDAGRVQVSGRVTFLPQDKPVYRQLTPLSMFSLAADLNVVSTATVPATGWGASRSPSTARVVGSPGGKGPRSRWPPRWARARTCCCSTSRWPSWTRWRAAK